MLLPFFFFFFSFFFFYTTWHCYKVSTSTLITEMETVALRSYTSRGDNPTTHAIGLTVKERRKVVQPVIRLFRSLNNERLLFITYLERIVQNPPVFPLLLSFQLVRQAWWHPLSFSCIIICDVLIGWSCSRDWQPETFCFTKLARTARHVWVMLATHRLQEMS